MNSNSIQRNLAMKRAPVLILAALLPVLSLASDERIELIKKMENDRIQAGVRKDVEAIAAVTADDYFQIDWNGQILNKAATLARIKSSEIRLQSNFLQDIDVRIHGDTAIVSGLATRKGSMNGEDVSGAVRYSRVYVNRDGRWQVVAFQQTPVAK
jgi:ketosteroid isomerase-like protein